MEAGNRVPADGRLYLTATLEIEEAALTGESVASPKDTEAIADAEAPLGDRHCMAYMNTSVTRGRGEMIVTTTGMGTEMGHIADLLNKSVGDIAYNIIDLDEVPQEGLLTKISTLEGVINLRLIDGTPG